MTGTILQRSIRSFTLTEAISVSPTEAMNQEDKYIVYYRKNKYYAGIHLPLIIIGIINSLIALIVPEFRAIAIFVLLFLVTLLALLILNMVRVRGEDQPLLEMDQTGIVDHNPGNTISVSEEPPSEPAKWNPREP